MTRRKTTSRSERTAVRAITFPIAEPEGGWGEFDARMKRAWGMSTALANWASSQLFMFDVTRTQDLEKLPPWKEVPVYLYGLFNAHYPDRSVWDGATESAQCILRNVERAYIKARWDVVWRRSASLRSYRYPFPFPVHNRAWRCEFDSQNRPVVTATLPGGRIRLRLRGGSNFRRQLAAFRRAAAGEVKRGELALYRQRIGGDDAQVIEDREPGGGVRRRYRTMCKLALHMPKREPVVSDDVLRVWTDPDHFLCVLAGNRVWYVNADHVRRWAAEHRQRLRRTSDDLKPEKRWPKSVRRRMVEAREAFIRKHRNRCQTWNHQVSLMLAEFARRSHVGTVELCVVNRLYAESYPWHELGVHIVNKLDERGIATVERTEEEAEPWQREMEVVEAREALTKTSKWLRENRVVVPSRRRVSKRALMSMH